MFLVCGEALIDMFIENNNSSIPDQFSLNAFVGGSPFNVAIGLARLGQSSSLLTGISNDVFGKRLSAVLEREGVSQELILRSSLPTTIAFIEKDKDGVPTYSFYGEGTADRSLEIKDVDLHSLRPTAIHLGSYSIVTQPTADSLLSLVKKYSGQCLISLDPNIRAIVEPNMEVWKDRVTELIQYADMVKVSDEDLELMFPNLKPEAIIQKWLALGLKLIVLTRGSKGSSLWSKVGRVNVKSPKINVIDTVGAGDTYQAALLSMVGKLFEESNHSWSEFLTKDVLQEIGIYATNAAAITCSRQGANLPTQAELSSFSTTK